MRDRMPPEKRARAKSQSDTTNRRNALALVANGFGVSRTEAKVAEGALADEVGDRQARKLMKQAAKRAWGSF